MHLVPNLRPETLLVPSLVFKHCNVQTDSTRRCAKVDKKCEKVREGGVRWWCATVREDGAKVLREGGARRWCAKVRKGALMT